VCFTCALGGQSAQRVPRSVACPSLRWVAPASVPRWHACSHSPPPHTVTATRYSPTRSSRGQPLALHLFLMDLLIQLLLCLVFVLSLALYFQIGSDSQRPSTGSGSGKGSSSSKSKSKKKSKKPSALSQAPAAQSVEATAALRSPKEGGEQKAHDLHAPPPTSVSDEVVASSEQTRDTSKLAEQEDNASKSSAPGKKAAVSTSSSLRQGLNAEDETVDLASFRDQSDRSREGPVEDAWQSVGKGGARLNKPVQSCESSNHLPNRRHILNRHRLLSLLSSGV
jgi:hypothetical protein